MQGLVATATTGSLIFLAPRYTRRHHSPILNKYVNQRVSFPRFDSLPKLQLSANSRSPREIAPLSASSKHLSGHGLPPFDDGFGRRRRRQRPFEPAFNDKLPKIAERPEWWWRTLACIPYLISLQVSDVGIYVRPFLEKYDATGNIIKFIPGAITRWPRWFFMLYCYLGYTFLVKNKDVPHFFRFHVIMGMLLETGLQIIWCTSDFFPLIHSRGRLAMYYETAMAFAYICLLLECIRCALAGIYPQIPFVTDAASIHTRDTTKGAIYFIWRERNSRLHSGVNKPATQIVKEIQVQIRAKLLGMDKENSLSYQVRSRTQESFISTWFDQFQA